MPTDLGYRYYVESIIESVPLPPVEQLMIRHQFGQVEFASEHWFRLAATTLASATHAAGIATPAKPAASRVRRVDIVAINERLVSLILVLREGTVKQVLVNLDEPVEQPALNATANRLNHEIADLTALRARWRDRGDALRAEPRSVRDPGRGADPALDAGVRRGDDRRGVQRRPAQRHGRARVRPEREAAAGVRGAARTASCSGGSSARVAGGAGVRVFIGEENPAADMHEVSLVLAPYGRPGHAVGVVGVLGPTRMSYPQAIGTVGFVSGLMNELVEHLYA